MLNQANNVSFYFDMTLNKNKQNRPTFVILNNKLIFVVYF